MRFWHGICTENISGTPFAANGVPENSQFFLCSGTAVALFWASKVLAFCSAPKCFTGKHLGQFASRCAEGSRMAPDATKANGKGVIACFESGLTGKLI